LPANVVRETFFPIIRVEDDMSRPQTV